MKRKSKFWIKMAIFSAILSAVSWLIFLQKNLEWSYYAMFTGIIFALLALILMQVEAPANTERIFEIDDIKDLQKIDILSFEKEKRIADIKILNHGDGIYKLHINGALGKEEPKIGGRYIKSEKILFYVDPSLAPKLVPKGSRRGRRR